MRNLINSVQRLDEGRDAVLYHAIKYPDNAVMALKNDEILATSTQRFWADGKRRKDNDPDYEKSFWMKGISTTRDIKFAMWWGSVVLVLSQRLIAQRYKIIPFNWGYSIPSGNHHKREREEFIPIKTTQDRYTQEDEYGNFFDWNRFKSPEGSLKPLSNYLVGFMAEKEFATPYLIEHPKLISFY